MGSRFFYCLKRHAAQYEYAGNRLVSNVSKGEIRLLSLELPG